MCDFSELKGKILSIIIGTKGDDEIYFICRTGETYRLWHDRECCECVDVEEVLGDISDLIGSEILLAEEVVSDEAPPLDPNDDSYLWTFYKLATIKGAVTIRWYGTSNGYYAMGVDFEKTKMIILGHVA